jgi:hypothetical protein
MRRRVNKRLEAEEKLDMARAKKDRRKLHVQRQLQAEGRRVERERLKMVREKALQLSQKGKRKVPRRASSNDKRQRRVGELHSLIKLGSIIFSTT